MAGGATWWGSWIQSAKDKVYIHYSRVHSIYFVIHFTILIS